MSAPWVAECATQGRDPGARNCHRQLVIGNCSADEGPGIVECLHRATARLVVEERIVGYLEEPRTETSFVLIARRREISLDQCILCQVIGVALIATTKGEQETAEGFLLTLYVGYEYVACHDYSAVTRFSSASISLASIFLLRR